MRVGRQGVPRAVKLETSGLGKELAKALERTLLGADEKKKEWEKVRVSGFLCTGDVLFAGALSG